MERPWRSLASNPTLWFPPPFSTKTLASANPISSSPNPTPFPTPSAHSPSPSPPPIPDKHPIRNPRDAVRCKLPSFYSFVPALRYSPLPRGFRPVPCAQTASLAMWRASRWRRGRVRALRRRGRDRGDADEHHHGGGGGIQVPGESAPVGARREPDLRVWARGVGAGADHEAVPQLLRGAEVGPGDALQLWRHAVVALGAVYGAHDLGCAVPWGWGFAVPVCLGFSLIVMYDAIGVRRHAGIQAEVLNKIVEDLFQGHPISEIKLKELLGHTPSQVIAGAFLGILVACFICQGCIVI
uniref:Uncharacterized protein n=1 Tax=Ananas comosus var. bracteatus TaxID=296719 RepID=A0A6V7PTM9_ANACO|nr:unnamed protein product [Ananas comosus var. bracteatus]